MGTQERARSARVDAWLGQGGVVLASSERAARSVTAAFHAVRRAEGRMAWPTPAIFAWDAWVQERWLVRNQAGLLLLNPLQEQAAWKRVIHGSALGAGLAHPDRLAQAAQRAYRLICDYAPGAIKRGNRLGWPGDSAIFSDWLAEFESRCRRDGLMSASLLGLQLTDALRQEDLPRPKLMLIGFDRLLETQRALADAWGEWRREEPDGPRVNDADEKVSFFAAPDEGAELEACVRWLGNRLRADPEARLMVITNGLQERRGEMERALLDAPANLEEIRFEFSLGVPLGRVGLVRSAILLLRWLHEPLTEPELDWLLGSGYLAANASEAIAQVAAMSQYRERGQERLEWALDEFCDPLEGAWPARLLAASDQLRLGPLRQSPLDWVRVAEQLLESSGWPGFRPTSSVAFQARERWEKVLEDCGSLGFNGGQMDWAEFVGAVAGAVSGTIFAAESTDAPVLITEPVASAGQLADGIWFLGANQENWPMRGQPHPLLPIGLQSDAGMPHASSQGDWELAAGASKRLLVSASEVVFSYASHAGESEARPSRLAVELLGVASALPEELISRGGRDPRTERFEDWSRIPFPLAAIDGGAATLTSQSLCPFQAFGKARLGGQDWEPAEAGLNAKQRGILLHAVLQRVWARAAGLSGWEDLQRLADREAVDAFVRPVVDRVMRESFDPGRHGSLPDRFPARLLGLEAERLTGLVCDWLAFERERIPFTVEETEVRREVHVAGLKLKLRLDRIDELENGTELVIDYKSGLVGPGAWDGDRPDDVQLPLYATFAVDERLEGLVFGRVRAGDVKFYGRVRDARGTLHANLHASNLLVKNPLDDVQLEGWRELIERLGEDFARGRADVNPKDPVKTCGKCCLHAVCRIGENQPIAVGIAEEGDESEDTGGEGG